MKKKYFFDITYFANSSIIKEKLMTKIVFMI
jgi:hypothetical protein